MTSQPARPTLFSRSSSSRCPAWGPALKTMVINDRRPYPPEPPARWVARQRDYMTEAHVRFDCFGSTCETFVIGDVPGPQRRQAVAGPELPARLARALHALRRDSELSRLNADPRPVVPVSDEMARFAEAVVWTARQTGGLVDGTLLGEIEAAGYGPDPGAPLPLPARSSWPRRGGPPGPALTGAGSGSRSTAPAAPSPVRRRGARQRRPGQGPRRRPAGNACAARTFAVNAAGDVRVGGAGHVPRPVHVASPFDGSALHSFSLADAGIATSAIGRRSWLGADGAPAHHLLDPATGRPAFTGVVQATAIAPTALEAEARAKAAVLSGPEGAAAWLADGGVLVLEAGAIDCWSRPPRPRVPDRLALLGLPHPAGGEPRRRSRGRRPLANASPSFSGSPASRLRPVSIDGVSGSARRPSSASR